MAISPIRWRTQGATLRPHMEVVSGSLEGLMTAVAVPIDRDARTEKELQRWRDLSEQTLITIALDFPNMVLPMDRIEKVFGMLTVREGSVCRYLGVCATCTRKLIGHVFSTETGENHELLVCKFIGESHVMEIVPVANRGDLGVVDIMIRGLNNSKKF